MREYYLVSSISGSVTTSVETWLVGNGASKHMIMYKCTITNMNVKNFTCKVELRDNATYSSQGVRSTSFQLSSGDVLHVEDILYVPGSKNNLLSVLVLESKGFIAIFMDNQALLWPKNKDLKSHAMIGVRQEGIYKLLGKYIHAMIHYIVSPCKIWHKRLGNLHYKVLP